MNGNFVAAPHSSWLGSLDAGDWSAFGVWATVVIYVVVAIVAWQQLRESSRLRRAEFRPYVVVDIPVDWLLEIRVENIGKTLARNVTFEFPVPLASTMAKPWEVEESPLLNKGIAVLPPGKHFEVFLDSSIARLAPDCKLPLVYEAIVRYEDDNGERYEDHYTLDMHAMMHARAPSKSFPDLVQTLEKIERRMDNWTDGISGLLVHSRDKDAMLEADRQRQEQRRAESRAAQAKHEGAVADSGTSNE